MFKPDTECVPFNGRFYTIKFNELWLLLYYHDFAKAGKWDTKEQGKRNSEPSRYSILYSINPRMRRESGYEFLLEYPEITGYNRWLQSENPMRENKNCESNQTIGYTPINVTWKTDFFAGLSLSLAREESLLDGSQNCGYGWYALGYPNVYYGAVPGPSRIVNKTRLWIRVSSFQMCSIPLRYSRSERNVCVLFMILLI